MAVQAIPADRPRITPYLVVKGVLRLIEFLKQVFDAEEVHRTTLSDGRIMHAEVRIGDARVMMGEPSGGGKQMPGSVFIYVNDADATYRRALEVGGTSLMEPADQYHGDRYGGVEDPLGNQWWMATHVEDVSSEEIARREEEFLKQMSQA